MGFHLSNLFCRFKRTVCLFVCFFKVPGIATKTGKPV